MKVRRVRRGRAWTIETGSRHPRAACGGRYTVGVTSRNIATGETIVQRFSNQRGHGVYRGTVSFHRASAPGQMPMGADGITVGRFSVRLP